MELYFSHEKVVTEMLFFMLTGCFHKNQAKLHEHAVDDSCVNQQKNNEKTLS